MKANREATMELAADVAAIHLNYYAGFDTLAAMIFRNAMVSKGSIRSITNSLNRIQISGLN